MTNPIIEFAPTFMLFFALLIYAAIIFVVVKFVIIPINKTQKSTENIEALLTEMVKKEKSSSEDASMEER